ncbi:glycosyltransferase family 4 protein, partial [Acidobacteriota bacterium]
IAKKTWISEGKAKVRYLDTSEMRIRALYKLLKNRQFDLVYLNSFFSIFSIKILLLYRFGFLPRKPIVLAPRGEFSPGALALKKLKKNIYINISNIIGLYRGIVWQASSKYEMKEIITKLRKIVKREKPEIYIASNLPPKRLCHQSQERSALKQRGEAKIIFLSRIHRMKNLDFALRLLKEVNGKVEFDIFGPIVDKSYWQECGDQIKTMPQNISVVHKGIVYPDQVSEIFSRYHLFLFPTRGENFAHVILEALHSGCLVLTSDKTPWRYLEEAKVGWDEPLDKPEHFTRALHRLIAMNNINFQEYSKKAHDYAQKFAQNPSLLKDNRDLLLRALRAKE